MKKLLLLCLLFMLTAMFCFAQDTIAVKTTVPPGAAKPKPRKANGNSVGYTDTIGFKPLIFQKLINKQFSTLLTGKTNSGGVGNYADLDIADGEVSFQGSSISSNGSVFSIKAAGGIDEGVFNIFDHSKLNSNLSLEFKFDLLSLENQQITYEARSYNIYKAAERKAWLTYNEQELFLKMEQQNTIWKSQKLQFENQKGKLRKVLDTLNTNSDAGKLLADSISYNIAKIDYQLDTLNNTIHTAINPIAVGLNNRNDRITKVNALLDKVDIRGFEFQWWSFSYKAKRSDFKLFNSSAVYDEQVQKNNFLSHEAKIQLSHYKWTDIANETFFWDIGAAFTYSDNLASLNKLELVEETQYGAIADLRKSVKKYNVYYGEYEKDLLGLKLYADYYKFFFNNNVMALHLYPEYEIKRKLKPVLNTGFGLLFAFKDNKKEKAVVNAELYYNFLDVFKTTDVDYRLFERNEVGIRFVFPLTFKTL